MLQVCINIKKKREELGLTQNDLAKKVGYSDKSMISMIEHGKSDISQKKLVAIADALGTTPSELLGNDGCDVSYTTYPVVGEIKCGYDGILQEENTGDTEQIPNEWLKGDDPNSYIVLRAKGDSLYPLIMDSDRLLIHKTTSVESGTLAAVIVGEECTLKRVFYKQGEDWVRLEAVNPSYPPRTFSGSELLNVRVLGEVRQMIRRF